MSPVPASTRLALLGQQAKAIRSVFESRGCVAVEPSILQPADIFLELSGEAVRQQMFVMTDISGEELCLRPEFTIPVCRMYLEQMLNTQQASKLYYDGPAFRAQRDDGKVSREFLQAGVEYIGEQDRDVADREVLALAIEAVKCTGLDDFELTVGNLALVWTFLGKLDLPERWRTRLRRHFSKPQRFSELLEKLANGSGAGDSQKRDVLAKVKGLEKKDVCRVVESLVEADGQNVMGGRTIEEIAVRLLEQSADSAEGPLSSNLVKLIDAFLNVKGPLEESLDNLNDIAKNANVDLKEEISRFGDSLSSLSLPDDISVSFAADLGRGMDYYTGFVFDIRDGKNEQLRSIVSGGRYDRLLSALGASVPIPAVGCAIRTERLLAARQARGAV